MSDNAPSTTHDRGLRREISQVGLLFVGVGSIIGSGWLYSAFTAAQIAGPAALVSWVLGAVVIAVIALVFADLGTMFPLGGGVTRFPHFAFGSSVSFMIGWIGWIGGAATVSVEVVATLEYAGNYLPWLVSVQHGVTLLTWSGLAVAAGLIVVFTVLNLVAVWVFIRFNNIIVWWKLAIIVLLVASLVTTKFDTSNFAGFGGFAPYGASGIFAAVASGGIIFSFQGFRQGIQYAGESKNPRRHIPVALFGSLGLALVVYLALQIAFLGALPGSALSHGWSSLRYENAFGPFAGVALILGLTWLAVILYVDAVISPAGAGLIWAGEATRMAYGVGRNERRLAILAWVNKNGVPWVSVAVSMVVSALLLLPFPSWQRLVGFSTSTGVLMSACCCVSLGCVRRQFPGRHRPFRLKGGDALPLLAFFAANCVTLWSQWSTNWKTVTVVAVGYILLALSRIRGGRGQGVGLRLRSASWLVPWLGGMLVVSWLSTFGGTGVLGTGASLALTAVVSAVSYACGVAVRLPGEAAAAQLGDQLGEPYGQHASPSST